MPLFEVNTSGVQIIEAADAADATQKAESEGYTVVVSRLAQPYAVPTAGVKFEELFDVIYSGLRRRRSIQDIALDVLQRWRLVAK